MLDRTDDSSVAADTWLTQFEEALGKLDEALLKTLFHPDSYWRDVLALSWDIQTLNGRDAILKALPPLAGRPAQGDARGHQCDRGHLQVRDQSRARQRHHPADPRCGRWQPAESLDAVDRAWRAERF